MVMKTIIQFMIQKGGVCYTTHANDFPIFTQAETFDGLIRNVQEATELHFADENLSEVGLSGKPVLFVNFEIPQHA